MTTNVFADVRRVDLIARVPQFSTEPDKMLALCKKLIEEEAIVELLPALHKFMSSRSLENLAEVVDGAIDTIWVVCQLLDTLGLDASKHWQLVRDANMAKFPNGVALFNEAGKYQKPAGWVPPDHMPLLIEWNSERKGDSYKGNMIVQP